MTKLQHNISKKTVGAFEESFLVARISKLAIVAYISVEMEQITAYFSTACVWLTVDVIAGLYSLIET